jgi:hypothetical protein
VAAVAVAHALAPVAPVAIVHVLAVVPVVPTVVYDASMTISNVLMHAVVSINFYYTLLKCRLIARVLNIIL